jgi:hypothetical protein
MKDSIVHPFDKLEHETTDEYVDRLKRDAAARLAHVIQHQSVIDTVDERPHAQLIRELEMQIERSLSSLGKLEPEVIGALVPQRVGNELVLWPSQGLGRVRVVRRERGVLFATQGLSFPFDPSMHRAGGAAMGYEIGIEVARDELSGNGAALNDSWMVPVLLFMAGSYVKDRFPLLEMVTRFGLTTQILPVDPDLEQMRTELDDGTPVVGALAGMPLSAGGQFGREGQHVLASVDGHESRLVVFKVLCPDEYAWARGVNDSGRCVELARTFWEGGDGHVTRLQRASVLAKGL